MTKKTVFISYSHVDEKWKDKLLPQLLTLETAGLNLQVWHDRKIDGGDQWYPEILAAMENSAAAVLLISGDFLASKFCVNEEVPALLKRQENEGMLLVPVLLRDCVWKAHRWLSSRQLIPRDGQCVAINFAGDLADTVFKEIALQVYEHFEAIASKPEPEHLSADAAASAPLASAVPWPALPGECIDLTRLPVTGSALFGRDAELARLDEAWTSPAGAAPVRVLAFIAHGGVGKSTLVNHWLAEMAGDHYSGASQVFGWSFYSQGVREQTAASADSFIDAALRFFGDSDPTAGAPWDKGARLAHLVGRQRALLVLDGLEPLQSPHAFERGKLRDPGLQALLRGLARQSAGLCLITSRERLTDLADRPGLVMHDLEQISAKSGRALLRTTRVVGTDDQLLELAGHFGPHALAVSLLGVYLYAQPGHGIAPAAQLAQLPGKAPIDRVLAGFEQWLGEGPECDTLRLLGLFDRPADAACLRALRQAPAIPGLTGHLAGLDDAAWNRVLDRLAKLRLVQVLRDDAGQATVDTHPLVREHFAELLKAGAAWKAGHQRLFEHLCATTEEGDSPSLEDLQPLYQAVAHGCQAGLQQKACTYVFLTRIRRGNEEYSTKKLGAFGFDLGAVACFFTTPWSHISLELRECDRAWLMAVAAYTLRALGQLTDAIDPSRTALTMRAEEENWVQSSISASNLGEVELTFGSIASAIESAELSVIYAERSRDKFRKIVAFAKVADVLHQAGRRAESEKLFREAEALQVKFSPTNPLLYSLQGSRYCDLLLSAAERSIWLVGMLQGNSLSHALELRRIWSRATMTLQWLRGSPQISLLSMAINRLILGRVAFYSAILTNGTNGVLLGEFGGVDHIQVEIDSAIDGIRSAGETVYLPPALLTRAWLRCLQGQPTGPDSAQTDLDDAWDIAENGPMPLFLADIHLHRARLFFREKDYPWSQHPDGSPRGAQDDLKEARRLIEKHGYGRRKEELEDAEAALRDWQATTTSTAP